VPFCYAPTQPLKWFKTGPEIIRLAVMLHVRFPLSLRNFEDLLHERGVENSHETVRFTTYQTRERSRQDVFEYIEMFYNPERKFTNNGMLSPVDFKTRQKKMNEAGIQKTMGTSVQGSSSSFVYKDDES
jgi:hypothetical protein